MEPITFQCTGTMLAKAVIIINFICKTKSFDDSDVFVVGIWTLCTIAAECPLKVLRASVFAFLRKS